jgi:hypothetical protein
VAAKQPEEVIAALDWEAIYVRVVAYAKVRLRSGSLDDARRIAGEAIRTLLDDNSEVTWNYETEPDPMWCLGSIVNGLVNNHVRKKVRKAEVLTDDVQAVSGTANMPADQEARLIAADLLRKVLEDVYDMSSDDPLVQELVLLAHDGVLDVTEQAERLHESTHRIYEARRRFRERVAAVRRKLEEEP